MLLSLQIGMFIKPFVKSLGFQNLEIIMYFYFGVEIRIEVKWVNIGCSLVEEISWKGDMTRCDTFVSCGVG